MPGTKVSIESGFEAPRNDLTVWQQLKCTLKRRIKLKYAQVRILTLGCSQMFARRVGLLARMIGD